MVYTDLKAAAGLPSFVVTTFVVSWVWLGAFVFRNIFVGTIVHGNANPRSTFECCPSSSVLKIQSILRIRSIEPLETAIDSCHVNFAIVTNLIKIVELSMGLESLFGRMQGFRRRERTRTRRCWRVRLRLPRHSRQKTPPPHCETATIVPL